jgi:thioredoxin 1
MGIRTKAPTLPADENATTERQLKTIDITDADFDQLILAGDRVAVVDFWADWCEPCHTMSAFVEFLASDYADKLVVAALDVEENPQIPERYSVMGLPTLIFFANGKEVDRQVGITPYDDLKQKVEQLLHGHTN